MGENRHERIAERIETKKADYARYGFSPTEDAAFKTFFDLAQEFDDIEDFYALCVAIPREFFDLQARLYLVEEETHPPRLAASTDGGSGPDTRMVFADHLFCTLESTLVLPIRGKKFLMDQLPFKAPSEVMGLLQVYPEPGLDQHILLFLEKYANRIGFNLHNRFLVEKNTEHLRFIRSLVVDIEHNIIVPNMVYKLLLRNLQNRMQKSRQLEERLDYLLEGTPSEDDLLEFQAELVESNDALEVELDAIEKHYKNMSLFLETLFRRGHFDQGRLVLRTKPCNMNRDVVEPQLAQYLERFQRMGIAVDDQLSGIPDEETITVVDVGLLSQVYANLFSNALKYCQDVVTPDGQTKKYISYGREVIKDRFGPGRDGIKYNVFSTGPHINPAEHERIFDEGYRGEDFRDRPGTGHGLSFVRNVISLHNGVAGYEPTQFGNNFYFILPT